MGTRGRKSAASLETVVVGNFGSDRAPPPEELNEAQARVWRDTISSENADFFRTAALRSLLVDYCRHTVTANLLSRQMDAMLAGPPLDDTSFRRYEMLSRLRERETKAAAYMATKLRLTNQSRYVPHSAARQSKNSGSTRPWEVE